MSCAWLAEQTEGFSGAQIEGACRRAVMAALARQIAASAENPDTSGLEIRRDHFLAAIEEMARERQRSAMDEYYYLYAITWAKVVPQGLPPGVDPRFPVEIVPSGQVAGVASRVGLDHFHPEWLQAENADVARLSEVALQHNAIVDALASHWATLPLRLGALFQSRASLVAKLVQCEAEAVEFLRRLADRQEWAVKVYLAEDEPREPVAAQQRPAGRGDAGKKRRHTIPGGQAEPGPATPASPGRRAAGSPPWKKPCNRWPIHGVNCESCPRRSPAGRKK